MFRQLDSGSKNINNYMLLKTLYFAINLII